MIAGRCVQWESEPKERAREPVELATSRDLGPPGTESAHAFRSDRLPAEERCSATRVGVAPAWAKKSRPEACGLGFSR